jgi:hypothetical protein
MKWKFSKFNFINLFYGYETWYLTFREEQAENIIEWGTEGDVWVSERRGKKGMEDFV